MALPTSCNFVRSQTSTTPSFLAAQSQALLPPLSGGHMLRAQLWCTVVRTRIKMVIISVLVLTMDEKEQLSLPNATILRLKRSKAFAAPCFRFYSKMKFLEQEPREREKKYLLSPKLDWLLYWTNFQRFIAHSTKQHLKYTIKYYKYMQRIDQSFIQMSFMHLKCKVSLICACNKRSRILCWMMMHANMHT